MLAGRGKSSLFPRMHTLGTSTRMSSRRSGALPGTILVEARRGSAPETSGRLLLLLHELLVLYLRIDHVLGRNR